MKSVEGQEGRYLVNEHGEVFSSIHGEIKKLKPIAWSDGYLRVPLYFKQGGGRKMASVHRVVAEAFLPKIQGKGLINHKNGIKTDNRLENLEWCNHSENQRHAVLMGLHRTGPTFNHLASEAAALRSSGMTFQKIADKLGVAISTAHRLCRLEAR